MSDSKSSMSRSPASAGTAGYTAYTREQLILALEQRDECIEILRDALRRSQDRERDRARGIHF